MQLTLEKIKEPVKAELKAFEPLFSEAMQSKVPFLKLITNYILRRKGKQMRPMFVMLSAKMHQPIADSTFVMACLIELLHTATLIHDDVVDETYQRRGVFSLNALWKSKVSVLVGDFLLSKGLQLAVEKKELGLLEIVSTSVQQMSEGELLQIQESKKLAITEEIYFEVIRKKTASLIAACTAGGAKSVGVSAEVIEKMRLFGEYAGMAFQIKDDIFDYQKNKFTGKPSGNDIKEKKLTLPLIFVLKNISASERKRIRGIIAHHNQNPEKVNEVIDFVVKNKGLEYAEEKMMEFRDKANAILDEFPKNDARESLKNLVDFSIKRIS